MKRKSFLSTEKREEEECGILCVQEESCYAICVEAPDVSWIKSEPADIM